MTTPTQASAVDQSLLYPSPYKEFWQAFSKNKGAVAGLLFMLLIVFCAIFAPWVAPHNPSEQYRDFLLTPPAWLEGGQMQFLLGTDELGRDLLSRLIQGSRLSLLIGLSSVVMSLIPGILLGLFAGFFPRLLGPTIMRLMDIMMALPSLLLAVAVVAVLGPGLGNTMIAIAIVYQPHFARLTRAVLDLHRDMPQYRRQQQRGEWKALPVRPASQRRVGVLGLGSLGQAVLQALQGLGFACAGWSRSQHQMDGICCYAGSDELPAFLEKLDVLVCLLPLTDAARHSRIALVSMQQAPSPCVQMFWQLLR